MRRRRAPLFTGLCPECGAETERFPRIDSETGIKGFRCRNGHVISVKSDGRVLSVTIPFSPPNFCPICHTGPCVVEAHTRYEVEDGVEEAARLRCPKGHRFPYRQLCFRQFGLPVLPKEIGADYY